MTDLDNRILQREFLLKKGWAPVTILEETTKQEYYRYQRRGTPICSLKDALVMEQQIQSRQLHFKFCQECKQKFWLKEQEETCWQTGCKSKYLHKRSPKKVAICYIRSTEDLKNKLGSIARQAGHSTIEGYVAALLREKHPELEKLR